MSANNNINHPRVQFSRPNRKNKKQVKWTYELKKSLYECYVRAETNLKGYMNRLKNIWDEEQPEYSTLDAKNLRNKVSWIIIKKDIAELKTQDEGQQLNQIQRNAKEQDSTEDNERYRNNEPPSANELPTDPLTALDEGSLKELDGKFHYHYNQFIPLNVNERPYKTHLDRKIPEKDIDLMNIIIENS